MSATASGNFSDVTINTALDLNTAVPRSGQDMLGGYAWLGRLADKVRAEQAGTQGDYVAYCPLSMGFLECAGVSADDFDGLIERGASDDELVRYFDEHVSADQRELANRYVLEEHTDALKNQDTEESRQA